MPRHAAAALAVAAFSLAACSSPAPPGALRLLERTTRDGTPPVVGRLELAGDARPALLASAAFRVRPPQRALLTFGAGISWAGEEEAPGWYRLSVRAGEATLWERRLNPRALRGFRDVSAPLPAVSGGELEIDFEIAFEDREGQPLEQPPGLLLGVAEPTVHDLAAYGEHPLVLLVSIDTLRRDHVGAYGHAKPTTPRLDALAAAGRLFEDAVSTSSWTLPAHLSMLTSTDPGVHGGTDMDHGFAGTVPTLPQVLSDAGWATRAVTGHLYVSSVYGLDTGFDFLDFHQDRKAAETADRAIALLDRFGDGPLFLFLHFYDPHWHYDPPAEQLALFEEGYSGDLTGIWRDFSNRDRDSLTQDDLEHLLALYDGEIRYTDDQLGRVLDHMAARGLERNALVVATSDHGEEFLDHGAWEHQRTLYEEVIRIPLLLAGPRVPPGRVAEPASVLDVAPTVLDWAGLPPLPAAQGRTLLGAVPARESYGETDHTVDATRKLFLRAGAERWKAILSLDAEGERILAEEWFDLAADPGELDPEAPGAAVADAIRKRALARWHFGRRGVDTAPPISLSPEQRERLRALGYVSP